MAMDSLQLKGFELTFGRNHKVQKQEVDAVEDDTPDEKETLMAQELNKVAQSDTYPAVDENDESAISVGVRIIGVERKSVHSGDQWYYLRQPSRLTLNWIIVQNFTLCCEATSSYATYVCCFFKQRTYQV